MCWGTFPPWNSAEAGEEWLHRSPAEAIWMVNQRTSGELPSWAISIIVTSELLLGRICFSLVGTPWTCCLDTLMILSHCSHKWSLRRTRFSQPTILSFDYLVLRESFTHSIILYWMPTTSRPGLHAVHCVSFRWVWCTSLNDKYLCEKKQGLCRNSMFLLLHQRAVFWVNEDRGTGCTCHGCLTEDVGYEIQPVLHLPHGAPWYMPTSIQ